MLLEYFVRKKEKNCRAVRLKILIFLKKYSKSKKQGFFGGKMQVMDNTCIFEYVIGILMPIF